MNETGGSFLIIFNFFYENTTIQVIAFSIFQTFISNTKMQIELYAGYVPYIGLNVCSLQCFIPFRHSLEFFKKSPDHDMWSFEDMDEEEFTPEMRKIHDWTYILALDRSYNHGTMISCMNETIHGNRFSIHSKKDYRVLHSMNLDISFEIMDKGPELFETVNNCMLELKEMYPKRCTTHNNILIKPESRVSLYTMNCLKYTHVV